MKTMRKNKKGFTLIEIIVVLVILAVLIAALAPTMLNFINEARGKALSAQLSAGKSAAQLVWMEERNANPPTTGALGAVVLADNKFLTLVNEMMPAGGAPTGSAFSNLTFDANGHIRTMSYTNGSSSITMNSDGTVTTNNTGTPTAPNPAFTDYVHS